MATAQARPIAVWKDLCLDALDVGLLADFYAEAFGLRRVGETEHVRLEGTTPEETVWINAVDRAHVVKNRIHPDVYVESGGGLDRLVGLGARLLTSAAESGRGWSVLADPEGNEFCAFEREADALPRRRLHGIGVDCVDAGRTAGWWGAVLGVEPVRHVRPGEEWWTLEGATSPRVTPGGPTLDFAAVPEPRTRPHRMHWDVTARVEDLLAAGATPRWEQPGWVVLADPEGNEFCCFPPVASPSAPDA